MKAEHTRLSLAAAVCCWSMLGSSVGAKVALNLSEEQLRTAFMASLFVLGGRSAVAAALNFRRILASRADATATKGRRHYK